MSENPRKVSKMIHSHVSVNVHIPADKNATLLNLRYCVRNVPKMSPKCPQNTLFCKNVHFCVFLCIFVQKWRFFRKTPGAPNTFKITPACGLFLFLCSFIFYTFYKRNNAREAYVSFCPNRKVHFCALMSCFQKTRKKKKVHFPL